MHDNIIELSPAYDLLNSTISTERATEEFALPLAGKKRKITRKDLVTYFGMDWLRLTGKTIESEIQNIKDKKSDLESLIHISFLTKEMKEKYLELMSNRYERLME